MLTKCLPNPLSHWNSPTCLNAVYISIILDLHFLWLFFSVVYYLIASFSRSQPSLFFLSLMGSLLLIRTFSWNCYPHALGTWKAFLEFLRTIKHLFKKPLMSESPSLDFQVLKISVACGWCCLSTIRHGLAAFASCFLHLRQLNTPAAGQSENAVKAPYVF